VYRACYAGCVPEYPGCAGGLSWVVPAQSFPAEVNPAARVLLPAGLGTVRACTWLSAGSAARMARRAYR